MFVELKCKTNFSFLRGASSGPDYVLQAAQLGMPALGITDCNGVYALPRAYEAVRDKAPHLKLISGAEITMKDHPKVTLIAQSRKAYGLLCRILTQVHAGKEKGEGFLTMGELIQLTESFSGASEMICIPDLSSQTNWAVLRELFLSNTYMPLCRYLDGLDQQRTELARNLSFKFDVPLIATNDVHYHHLDRRPLQDALTCVREGVTMDEAGFHLFGNHERYLKTSLQMQALFKDLPDAIVATAEVNEKCHFKLSELKYTYPQEFIPEGHTPGSYLKQLALEGARDTYKGLIPDKVMAQIYRELEFFAKRGDEHYFLTVHDIVRFARESNIICQGRGSAANSIVCYVLGITSVDPVQMGLLFDRFMNEGRTEPPDIDVDFEHDRREEVVQYIYSRFGRDRAAMVAAVRTYRRKSAFLEISKALGVEVGTVSAGELEDQFDQRARDKISRRPRIDALVEELRGFPRHLSIHSGGFLLSDEPLCEIVPIEPARMKDRTIIQWDKDDLETLGLMKVDVLSIGFLTALHKATDLAGIHWRDIPTKDQKTFKMIQRGETYGTFQIESRAQISMLQQSLPEKYYDLVVQVALVRPSPTEGGMVQPYLKGRAAARKGWQFRIGNADLERILGRTYGVPIFQEQIMKISIDVAGFTPSEADQLRRSLAQHRSADSVNAMGNKLREALLSKGIPKKFAEDLFKYVQGYAHYGFPESHAASYASLAYKSAYMKCHHPAELLVGLINSQPMGFYSIDSLINEAKRNGGVVVLPIDPHKSVWEATLEAPNTVRMGFANVRQINKSAVEHMIQQREQRPFTGIEDFISRTQFPKEVLENFALANVFESFGLDRRHSFWKSLEFKNLAVQSLIQQSLFNEDVKLESIADLFSKMDLLEEISIDYRKTTYSLQGNMMKALRRKYPDLPQVTSLAVGKYAAGATIRFAGIMSVLQRPPPAKGTAFMTLEDEFGTVDTVLRNDMFNQFSSVIKHSRFLIIEGKVQKRGRGTSVLVSHVEAFIQTKGGPINQHGAHPRSYGRLGDV